LIILLALYGSTKWEIGRFFKLTVALLALQASLIAFFVISAVRFSYPVFPFLIILSACGLCSIARRGCRDCRREPQAGRVLNYE